MFHQVFGENMLRADVCNAVEELGQLLDHTGPVAASEKYAARIFNADHCFYVPNGTSTSNKMVWHHTVAPGDIVVVEVPFVTKKQWSALKMRAAFFSLAATGPVWSSNWPSSSTALHTSARSMFSPKN